MNSPFREFGKASDQSLPSTTAVCGIIVTYNPTRALLESIAAICPQVSHLLVVDNGSGDESLRLLELARQQFGCEVILNGLNLGIARALNTGIVHAESLGYKYVVLFDQDSIVADRLYIRSMIHTYEIESAVRRVAIVGATYVDRLSGVKLSCARGRDGCPLIAMTSGSLVPIEIFKTLGLHDERLYMDYVDVEFCLRCRHAGYSIIEAPEAVLLHSLGRRTNHHLYGREFSTTNHNSSRRYYITRNRLLLMRRYWRDWPWSAREMPSFVMEFIKMVLVEDSKREKLAKFVLGMMDAMSGKMGKQVDL